MEKRGWKVSRFSYGRVYRGSKTKCAEKRLERVKIFVYRRIEDEVYGKKGLESIKIFVYRRVDNEVYEKIRKESRFSKIFVYRSKCWKA